MSDLDGFVKKWRDDAKRAANGPMCDGASEYAVAGTYMACADELEAALAQQTGAVEIERYRDALRDCVEHMEHSTKYGRMAYEDANRLLASSAPGGGGEGGNG